MATSWHEPVSPPDSAQYLRRAMETRKLQFLDADYDLSKGLLFSRRVPPLFPLLLAPFAENRGFLEKMACAINISLSTLTVLLLALFCHANHSAKAALYGGLLLGFHGLSIALAGLILTESLYGFLMLPFLYFLYRAFSDKAPKWFALCGFSSGLLFLTRDAGLTNVPFCLILFATYCLLFRKKETFAQWAAWSLIFLTAFLIITAPQLFLLRMHTGKWTFTARQVTKELVAKEERLTLSKGAVERAPYLYLLKDKNPVKALTLLARNTRGYLKATMLCCELPITLGILLALLNLLYWGFHSSGETCGSNKRSIVIVITFLWMFHYILLLALVTAWVYDTRFLYPLLISGSLLAGLGYGSCAESLKNRKWSPLLLLLFCVFWQYPGVEFALNQVSRSKTLSFAIGHRTFATELLLSGEVEAGKTFLARKPYTPYHLSGSLPGRFAGGLPEDWQVIVRLLQSGEVDFIVADSEIMRYQQPKMVRLAIGQDLPPQLAIYSSYKDKKTGKFISLLSLKEQASRQRKSAFTLYEEGYYPQSLSASERHLQSYPEDKKHLLLTCTILLEMSVATRSKQMHLFETVPSLLPRLIRYFDRLERVAPKDKRVSELKALKDEHLKNEILAYFHHLKSISKP